MTDIQLIFAMLPILLSIETFSQKTDFRYNTYIRSCAGVFDSIKYTRVQFQNVLFFLRNSSTIQTRATGKTVENANEFSTSQSISCHRFNR